MCDGALTFFEFFHLVFFWGDALCLQPKDFSRIVRHLEGLKSQVVSKRMWKLFMDVGQVAKRLGFEKQGSFSFLLGRSCRCAVVL